MLGLTATPVRRDGQHPIIFMQCGPIRYQAGRSASMPSIQEVWPRFLDTRFELSEHAGIQEVFKQLVTDPARNGRIAADILEAYAEGRRIIVLTGRTEHIELLATQLAGKIDNLFVLQGRMPKKQRAAVLAELEALDKSAPRALLATASLVREGFDHPPLDTLALAMPVSWEGSLKQYAGRLHRDHAFKSDVRIYDYVDQGHAQLTRMWDKRRKGYASMGYQIVTNVP